MLETLLVPLAISFGAAGLRILRALAGATERRSPSLEALGRTLRLCDICLTFSRRSPFRSVWPS
jgi:hypothetical protein